MATKSIALIITINSDKWDSLPSVAVRSWGYFSGPQGLEKALKIVKENTAQFLEFYYDYLVIQVRPEGIIPPHFELEEYWFKRCYIKPKNFNSLSLPERIRETKVYLRKIKRPKFVGNTHDFAMG